MSLRQKRVPVHNLGIDLYLISNGSIVLERGFGFVPIYDQCAGGTQAVFDATGFSLLEAGKEDWMHYSYVMPYYYKELPVLQAWLIQQGLEWPLI